MSLRAITLTGTLAGLMLVVGCTQAPPPAEESTPLASAQPVQNAVERGRYLVTTAGCQDCHSPKNFGPAGPEVDPARDLSGHPSTEKLPKIPTGVINPVDGWAAMATSGFTAWLGPWGVSYARNLTPDVETGLGSWTEEMFIKTIRDGKHQGEGRPLLPPMPWQVYGNMTDDDLKAVFAYLRSIPAVRNPVPDPIPAEKLPK